MTILKTSSIKLGGIFNFAASGIKISNGLLQVGVSERINGSPNTLTIEVLDESLDLTWVNGSTNEEGITVERSSDGVNFAAIHTTAAGVTTYSDATAVPETEYSYRVRAFIGTSVSNYSNAVQATLLNPFDLAKIAFWQDSLDLSQNKLLDKSGNNNHFTLGSSYCCNNNAGVGMILKSAITIDLTQPFEINFQYFKTAAVTSGNVLGGDVYTFIAITNTVCNIGMQAGTLGFYQIYGTLGVWNHYRITGDGTSITVANITNGLTQTLSRGAHTTFVISRLLGRNGSGNFIHPVRYININNQYEWRLSENPTTTYAPKHYDRIGGNHATGNATATQVKQDDTYHNNLRNGYSIWENGSGGIVWVPYGNDGNPLTLSVGTDIAAGYAKTYDCPASLTHHNYCETGIKAPIALLSYDVDNYLFDGSNVATDLIPEMIAENVGNKIFCNKSVLNQYNDFIVFKEVQ